MVVTRGRRRDAIRNERRLLDATGEILRDTSPREVTMAMIAERAGLSTATAYRYHSSVDAVMNAYLVEVLTRLRDFSDDCPETGEALFGAVLAEWGRLVEVYGPAMVQMRSRRGFLERLRSDDELITVVRSAWARPLRGLLRSIGGDGLDLDRALYLYNVLFDPRDILDLRAEHGDVTGALDELVVAFRAALGAWAVTGR